MLARDRTGNKKFLVWESVNDEFETLFEVRITWNLLMEFVMVIELSGMQFGLKSYAWFQNRTSAQREFDLKSQVWFQTKIALHLAQLPLY